MSGISWDCTRSSMLRCSFQLRAATGCVLFPVLLPFLLLVLLHLAVLVLCSGRHCSTVAPLQQPQALAALTTWRLSEQTTSATATAAVSCSCPHGPLSAPLCSSARTHCCPTCACGRQNHRRSSCRPQNQSWRVFYQDLATHTQYLVHAPIFLPAF